MNGEGSRGGGARGGGLRGGGSSRGGLGARGGKQGVTVTRDSEGNLVFNKNRDSDNEHDSVEGESRPAVQVYGKHGKNKCYFCKDYRDHYSKNCPGFICYNCKEQGHFAKDCKQVICQFCGGLDHEMENCGGGGSSYSDLVAGHKRRIEFENAKEIE